MTVKTKVALLLALFFSALLLSSCETIKGAFEGAKRDWEAAKRVDDWMRKNLW